MSTRKPTDPFKSPHAEDPIVLVFYAEEGGALRPRSVFTQHDRGRLTEFDFDWCNRDEQLYQHESGSGPTRTIDVTYQAYWAAKGMRLKGARKAEERLPDLPGDPFENAEEGKTVWCNVCKDHFPDEDTCRHLFYANGVGWTGPGGEDGNLRDALDSAREPVLRSVRRFGVLRCVLRALREDGDLRRVRIPETSDFEDIDNAYDDHGCMWLSALDEKTAEATKATIAWLRKELRVQKARRASGKTVYVVRSKRERRVAKGTEERLTWAEALRRAKDLRSRDVRDVVIVHLRSKRVKPEYDGSYVENHCGGCGAFQSECFCDDSSTAEP